LSSEALGGRADSAAGQQPITRLNAPRGEGPHAPGTASISVVLAAFRLRDRFPNGFRPARAAEPTPSSNQWECNSPPETIESAYLRYANGVGHSPEEIRLTPIEGAPAWIDSEQ